MAEISSTEIFVPIIFFDGDRELDAGNIAFNPSIGLEKLRSLIGEHIGMDPHHISIFLSSRKKPRSAESHRKIPIHKISDLSAVARERNCFFFVVWKPPEKRERRRRSLRNFEDCVRMPTILSHDAPSFDGRLGLGFVDYENRTREMQRQIENRRYRISGVCEECLSMERPIPFHLCVYDAVTVAFRSPAGPIERPSK